MPTRRTLARQRTCQPGRSRGPGALAAALAAACVACGEGEQPEPAATQSREERAGESAAPAAPEANEARAEAPAPRGQDTAPAQPDLPPGYREHLQLLESHDIPFDWKHEIILEELAPDASPYATSVLLLTTESPSLRVAMASIRALGERDDPRIESHLVGLLDDEAYQRRAWAARVLGQVGDDSVREHLVARLAVERDTRVRKQLEGALSALEPAGAPHTAAQETLADGEGG